MSHRVAGFMALFAFASVCVIGMLNRLPISGVLLRAVAALFVFYLVGWAVGFVASKVLLEHFELHRPSAAGRGMEPPAPERPDSTGKGS